MARLKRTSPVLETARRRIAGLKAIGKKDAFGAELTEAIYVAKFDSVNGRQDRYNQKLAEIDQDLNDLQSEEAELADLNRRFLSAGEAVFGPDSNEYEMLGGTRKSERKKPTKKDTGTGTGGS
jgi:hypothetical protein